MASKGALGGGKSPLEGLVNMGIVRREDGGLEIPASVIQRIRAERVRQSTLSQVPSTPAFFYREGGGVGVNKGHARIESLSVEALRKVRERSVFINAIHSARGHQVRRMSRRWTGRRTDVGWRVVHKDHMEAVADPPQDFEPIIKRVETIIERPSARYAATTAALLVPLEEDLLTINRPCIETLYSRWDDGRIVGLRPVDGGLIWPTLVFLEQWAAKNPGWSNTPSAPREFDPQNAGDLDMVYEDILRVDGFDVSGAEFCCVREGNLEAIYQPKDILVYPLVTRTDVAHAGWPPSHVEEAIEVILTAMNTWEYNANFFTQGMVTDFIIAITGSYDEEAIAAFRDTLREATQGVSRAWKPPIMAFPEDGTVEKIDLKATNTEMGYETFQALQIAIMCGVYRMHPSTINAKAWDGGSGPTMSAPSQATEIALAQEEGLRCDLDHHADALTSIARRVHPDARVIFHWGPADEERDASVHEIRCKTAMTRNEVRLEMGLRPMGVWVKPADVDDLEGEELKDYESNLWNQPSDPTFVNQYAMANQEEQAQGQPDGFGGVPGAGGGGPGDFGDPQGSYPYGQEPEDGQAPPGGQGQPPPPGTPRPMEKSLRHRYVLLRGPTGEIRHGSRTSRLIASAARREVRRQPARIAASEACPNPGSPGPRVRQSPGLSRTWPARPAGPLPGIQAKPGRAGGFLPPLPGSRLPAEL